MYYIIFFHFADGIKLIHGNRGYFHNQAQPIFKVFYSAIQEVTQQNENFRKTKFHQRHFCYSINSDLIPTEI